MVFAALLGVIALAAAGCGGGHHKATPMPLWVQRANALCKPIDHRFRTSDELFDSAAWVSKLRHEVVGLTRLGFFRRIPAAAVDMEKALRLLASMDTRKLDVAVRRVRRDAARKGVHCSFGSVPLIQA